MKSRCLIVLMLLFGLVWAEPQISVQEIKKGNGPAIREGQVAEVGYNLALESGFLIDKSNPMEPFLFKVGTKDVIPGFSKGVLGMKVGEIRKVVIPPELGYGSMDLGVIPANSTLVFEVELFAIRNDEVLSHEHEHEHEHLDDRDHDHEGENLAEDLRSEEVLKKRDANVITRPAMFEYLIRDFFTQPWRYEDGYRQVWMSTLKLLGVFVLLLLGAWFGVKKGYLIL